MTDRISRDEMAMRMAEAAADRSTCNRLHVGSVILVNNRVVSTGYNGPPAGMPHCDHLGDDPCVEAVHAEANAIVFAARHGSPIHDGTLYSTHQPCYGCAALIVNSGIVRVVFWMPYRLSAGLDLLNAASVATMRMSR